MDMDTAVQIAQNDAAGTLQDAAFGFVQTMMPAQRQPNPVDGFSAAMFPFDTFPDSWCPGNQSLAAFVIGAMDALLQGVRDGQQGLNTSSAQAALGLVSPSLNLTNVLGLLRSANPAGPNSMSLYSNVTLECLGFTAGGKPLTTLLAASETLSKLWADNDTAVMHYSAAVGTGSVPASGIAGATGTCVANGTNVTNVSCVSSVPCFIPEDASLAGMVPGINTVAATCPIFRLCATAQAYMQLSAAGCEVFAAYFLIVGDASPLWPDTTYCVLF